MKRPRPLFGPNVIVRRLAFGTAVLVVHSGCQQIQNAIPLPDLSELGQMMSSAVGNLPGLGGAEATRSFSDSSLAPGLPEGLNQEAVYPLGRRMMLGLYSVSLESSEADPTRTNLQRVSEAGFTVIGPYFGSDEPTKQIDAAVDASMGFSWPVPPHPELVGVPIELRPAAIDALTDDEIASHVATGIRAVLQRDDRLASIATWSIQPEELRHWEVAEQRYLEVVAATVRELDPRQRPVWIYEPSHRDEAALIGTDAPLDLVVKGCSPTALPIDHRGAAVIRSLRDLVSAAASLERPAVAVLDLAVDLPGLNQKVIAQDVAAAARLQRLIRHDAFLAFTLGVRGLQIWSMHESRPGLTTHAEQFDAYASVVSNLEKPLISRDSRPSSGIEEDPGVASAPLTLSDVILFGTPCTGVNVEVIDGPATLESHDRWSRAEAAAVERDQPSAATSDQAEVQEEVQAEEAPAESESSGDADDVADSTTEGSEETIDASDDTRSGESIGPEDTEVSSGADTALSVPTMNASDSVRQPKESSSDEPFASINVRALALANHRVLLVVNSAVEPVRFRVNGLPANGQMVSLLDDLDEPFALIDDSFEFEIEGFGVAVWQIEIPNAATESAAPMDRDVTENPNDAG